MWSEEFGEDVPLIRLQPGADGNASDLGARLHRSSMDRSRAERTRAEISRLCGLVSQAHDNLVPDVIKFVREAARPLDSLPARFRAATSCCWRRF